MSCSQPAWRRTRSLIAAVLAVGALLSVVAGAATHDHHPIGIADGEVPAGVTVFDDRYPAVARLDPALLHALRAAATDAAHDGVRFYVNSGWRSEAYQQELFDEAVATYGSAATAARWVAPPGTSVHEAGDAADIGPDGRGLAGPARRAVRAVPDLCQRALALRAAPRCREAWLPRHVRRPDPRPAAALS
jgi:zinc D-Ala-D-Ala carboxypeptidase